MYAGSSGSIPVFRSFVLGSFQSYLSVICYPFLQIFCNAC